MKKYIEKLSRNVFARNLILAVCSLLVFLFLTNILLNLYTRHNVHQTVPDFSNMTLEEARKSARRGSLKLEVNDSLYIPAYEGGIILAQMPEAGAQVKSGRRIFLTVNSYRQRMVRVPYVTGFSLRQAKNNIEIAGLEIGKLIYKEDIATNYVLETRYDGQLIMAGSTLEAEQGSGVTLVVGMRADESRTTVPKVVGFPAQEAKSRLWEAGLNVEKIVYDDNIPLLGRGEARVYSQTPEQGSRETLGTAVTLRLTLDAEKVDQGSSDSDKAARRIGTTRRAEEQEQAQAATQTQQEE